MVGGDPGQPQPTTMVDVRNGKGMQIGDNNSQTNVFYSLSTRAATSLRIFPIPWRRPRRS